MTVEEFTTHLVDCPDCIAVLDGLGEVVPQRLCRRGRVIQESLPWDSDRIGAAAERLLVRLIGAEPGR